MEPGSPTQAMSVMFSSAGIAPDVALDAGCTWISFKTGRNKGQAHNLIKQEQMGLNQHVFHPAVMKFGKITYQSLIEVALPKICCIKKPE